MSWRVLCQVQCEWCFGGCWLGWGGTGSCGNSDCSVGADVAGEWQTEDGLCLKGQKSSRRMKMLVLFYLLLDEKIHKSCYESWIVQTQIYS